jgi:hypothetical protein
MQFIKQNLFLVIVGAVLLVGGGILLAMGYQKADDKDQKVQERQKVADDIHGIPTGGFIKLSERPGQKPQQIKDLEARLGELKDEDEKVRAECANWNSRTYKVLQMQNKVGGKEQSVSAFPDVEQFKNASLVLLFKNTYRKELGKLLATMSPVVPITQEQLDSEIKNHRTRLEQDALREAATRKKKIASTKPATSEPGGEETGTVMDFSGRAQEEAVKALMLRQATQGGKIYVAPGALDSIFGESIEPSATPAELWHAQLNLWVQGDIVQAISDANEESARLVGAKQGTVLTSAVRRLIKIKVDADYCHGPNVGGAPASPTGGGTGGFRVPGAAEPGAPSGASEENWAFTQHYCNADYDVLQYQFTVAMPARYIPTLESCLMQRNFHTIVKVDIANLTTGAQAAAAAAPVAGAAKADIIPPYYGPDAVMEVTFRGELLLLTSWERGKYNSTDKKWELPPLMPKDVLAGLPRQALRSEDNLRLSGPTK